MPSHVGQGDRIGDALKVQAADQPVEHGRRVVPVHCFDDAVFTQLVSGVFEERGRACNTAAMNLHLAEIAEMVAPGAHAVLLVDQAGWHLSARLVVPANITILALPPKSPRAQPGREHLADRMFVVGAYVARPRYATSEGCVGWAGAKPHAQGTSHAAK
jgi:hypothetical protein